MTCYIRKPDPGILATHDPSNACIPSERDNSKPTLKLNPGTPPLRWVGRRNTSGAKRASIGARGIITGMSVIKDHAVILRRLDFSENSQVLALFTRDHGKVRAIAKGVKRSTKTRFAPAPDLLDVGSAVLSARSADRERLAILTEWTPTQPLTGIRDEITRLYAAQYAAALAAELTEDWDPHIELFDSLVRALTGLAHGEPAVQCVLRFQRTLLDSVGSMPELDRCVGCQNPVASDGPVVV